MPVSIINELYTVMRVTWLCPALAAKRPQLRGKWNIHLPHIHNSAAGGRQPSFVQSGQADDPLIRVPQSNSHHRRDWERRRACISAGFEEWHLCSLTLVLLWWEDGRSRSTVQPYFGTERLEIKHRDVSSRTKMLKMDEWSGGRQVNHKMSFHGVAEWNNKKWAQKTENTLFGKVVIQLNAQLNTDDMSMCMPCCQFPYVYFT